MIKFKNTKVMNFEGALRGMRNPLNSWGKADSIFYVGDCDKCPLDCMHVHLQKAFADNECFEIGPNDMRLAQKLIAAGSDHRKFLRQIFVCVDITAPLYWWKEFDTYKVGTVANSCSTMHKIHSKPIELSDFSIDDFELGDDVLYLSDYFANVVADCENLRRKYLETHDKRYWKGLIQLLPESYNQMRTVTFDYENIRSMYFARKYHKQEEWSDDFMDWIDCLPYTEELIKYEKHS